jgi:hypothetical protein
MGIPVPPSQTSALDERAIDARLKFFERRFYMPIQVIGVFLIGVVVGMIFQKGVTHGMSREKRRLDDPNRRERRDQAILHVLLSTAYH